jgi:LytS/YehU family sensor histidine kinase
MWWQVLGGTTLHTILLTAAYRQRMRTLESSASWQHMRHQRAVLARKTMEARLQAMRARVDPRLLSEALADIERSCATDPTRADRMLEGLIDYLHRALPATDSSSTPLAAEIELATAYFDLARLRMNGQLTVVIEATEDARTARMPPMLLVPLLERVVGSVRSSRFRAVHVTGGVEGDRLRLTVAGTVPGTAWGALPGHDLDPLRERLTALFGREASLVVVSEEREHLRVLMEIPYERT